MTIICDYLRKVSNIAGLKYYGEQLNKINYPLCFPQ